MSLDVEGPEIEILKTVDWTRVRIDLLIIEYRVFTSVPTVRADPEASAKKLDQLTQLFNETRMYRRVAKMSLDAVFERLDLDIANSRT